MGSSFGPKEAYLVLYNALCCVGWARVLTLAVPTLRASGSFWDGLSEVYAAPGLADALIYVQTAAILEVVHAATGAVRSPTFVTAMQVGSRLAALFAVANSPESQARFGAGLMILSWAFVEVPRYAFYLSALITGDATKKTPYPLFWLRYSLFAVLYPTGITGELTVFLAAASDPAFLSFLGPGREAWMYRFVMSFPVIYAPGALPMILNMAGNRKSAFKKRFAKPPPPPRGLVFPKDAKGGRSSTPVAKAVVSAAISASDPALGRKALEERNWRFGYVKHWIRMVREQSRDASTAVKVAEAGLDKAYELFEFVSSDGTACSFKEAMSDAKNKETFHTGFIQGEGTGVLQKEIQVPYKGGVLKGDELKAQVKKWVDYGTIESSAGHAIIKSVDNPEWLEGLKNHYFVLLGAGSAMGPFQVLMALGLNVVAVDLDRPQIWERLFKIAKASHGTFTFPTKIPQEDCPSETELAAQSGCNLFTETPRIRNWLLGLYPDKKFTVGCYAYLNGALHVQVSLAMDAICKDLSEKRKGTSLAYLCTPTDLHLVPEEAYQASLENWNDFSKRLYCMVIRLLSGGKKLTKNAKYQMGSFYACNEISVAQGPNYALAKRIQHWRAVIARCDKSCVVSSNIAPATSTASVVQNRTFAWAYEGMPYFRPYEIFAPDTSNAVMHALLLFDLSDPTSSSDPRTKLDNPNQLFSYGAFHGGAWRCAFEVDSIGEASVLIYFSRLAKPYVAAAVVVAAVSAKYFGYV